ncbi:hypothetical protein DRO37_09030 [Candidatus Bathyarchaeota archaeon]|nr:MAG: hypothetical protein DRO37_09030 [Candidatus Bathyarchaeota archaeon]
MPVKLSDCEWFSKLYQKIYAVVNGRTKSRLPPPSEISVLLPSEVKVSHDMVYGTAFQDMPALWFREIPPDPIVFAHELIHLAKKDTTKVSEEEYAYNLACFVVFLARIDVMPRDILRLFEEPPSEEAILNAIEKVMGLKFNSIEEYFDFTGVIPYFAEYDLRARRVKRPTDIIALSSL